MNKDTSIETLRVLAVGLIVAFHLLNDEELRSVKSVYEHLAFSFQNVRLPLFTVISGYLYGRSPVVDGAYWGFLKGKLRRIFLPMCMVAIFEYLVVSLLFGGGSLTGVVKVLYLPYEHYWFVQSIILIFIVFGFFDAMGWLKSASALVLILMLSISLFFFFPSIKPRNDYFSVVGATYLLPYFVIGYLWARNDQLLGLRRVVVSIALLFVALVILQEAVWHGFFEIDFSKKSVMGFLMGVVSCSFLLAIKPSSKWIATVGPHVFAIYLFQGFGAAIGRRIGAMLVDYSPHLYFGMTLLVTLAFGCLISFALSKNALTAFLFLGSRWRGAQVRAISRSS